MHTDKLNYAYRHWSRPEPLPYSNAIVSTLRETAVTFTSASGDPIETYGEVDVVLCFRAVGREFKWTMVVADVTQPILGIYFSKKQTIY